jgi:sigma-B regulation protein RsbU (phosphoserine phosphatase)
MKLLIAWDDQGEAELLRLYLHTDNELMFADQDAPFDVCLQQGDWDAVLMTLTYPEPTKQGFAYFDRLIHALPDLPVLMACRPEEVINLPRFLNKGLRFYLIRDAQKDYIFLLSAAVESAVRAAEADAARKLADQLRQEINSVRLLQEAIIPRGMEPPPGYLVAARYEPSQVTVMRGQPVVMAGGDYYDLFRADEETLVGLIGDASGHGLKACMSIMTMHTIVRMLSGARYRDTAGFVQAINDLLCNNSIIQSGGGFITMLYAALNTSTHTVTWTSAGHPPALLHRLDSNEVVQIGANSDGGPPLGIAGEMPYEAYQFSLPPRSRLLLYSDGLADAFPVNGVERSDPFGVPGIIRALQEARDRPLLEALAHLFDASHAYTQGEGRHDDTSALLLERQEM